MWKKDDIPLVDGFESDKIGWEEALSASGGLMLIVVMVVAVIFAAIQRIF